MSTPPPFQVCATRAPPTKPADTAASGDGFSTDYIRAQGAEVFGADTAPTPSGPYTRAQFAAAVDEAHGTLHEADEAYGESPEVARAHAAARCMGAVAADVVGLVASLDAEAQRSGALVDEARAAMFAGLRSAYPGCVDPLDDMRALCRGVRVG